MRVDPITYDDIDDEAVRELFEDFPRTELSDTEEIELPTHFQVEAHMPRMMRHVLQALRANREDGTLSEELVKKLYLAVSMANDCGYCTGVYCTLLGEDAGSEAVVREFQRLVVDGELDGFEGDVVEFAIKITNSPHDVTDEDFEYLRETHGVSDREFVQIVYIVNLISGYNRVTTVFDCEYEDVYHDGPWMRI
jgi:uncharacterized peroxidase-related enzyme